MKISIISPLTKGTGNHTTTMRIGQHLENQGNTVEYIDSANKSELSLMENEKLAQSDSILALHAFKSGRLLPENLDIPTAVIFGGTDLNEGIKKPEQFSTISHVVQKADKLIAFSSDFIHKACSHWPNFQHKIRKIPQGVEVKTSNFSIHSHLDISQNVPILFLPASLREVKNPLLVLNAIKSLKVPNEFHLTLAGAKLDKDYAEKVERVVKSTKNTSYLGALSGSNTHAAMQSASAVLNSSNSECTPNSLLEAMKIGTPVIARDIPGVRSIVKNGETGMLYTCLLYTSPSPRDATLSRMPSSA